MPVDFDTTGFSRKLENLTAAQQIRIVNASLRSASQVVVSALQEATPVELTWPGGTSLLPDSVKPAFSARVGKGPDGYPQASILPRRGTAHVARWLEFGHQLVRGGRIRRARKTGQVLAGSTGKAIKQVPAINGGAGFIRVTFSATASTAIEAFKTTYYELIKKR